MMVVFTVGDNIAVKCCDMWRVSNLPLVEDFVKIVPVQVHIFQHGCDVGGVVSLGVTEECLTQLVNLLVLWLATLILASDLLQM